MTERIAKVPLNISLRFPVTKVFFQRYLVAIRKTARLVGNRCKNFQGAPQRYRCGHTYTAIYHLCYPLLNCNIKMLCSAFSIIQIIQVEWRDQKELVKVS